MGKRAGKNRHHNNHNNNLDQVKKKVKKEEVWRDHKEIHQNTYFKKYYQIQFESYFKEAPEQFEEFWAHMKLKLPVVFRINPNQPNYTNFKLKLFDNQFLMSQISQEKIEGEFEPEDIPKIEKISWFPNDLVYTINTNKQIFKKSKMLSSLHTYIQKATDSGLVTRQELVSMLPPLFLDVQPDDIVLDMCAAPGSKTSQMLECLYKEQRSLSNGCVIANDVEYSRANMLIHQVQRSGTAGMAVINHNGQFLPQLYLHRHGSIKEKFLFDKVLCDVPCSGDGATRKLPNKWSNWHSNDGMVLHPLQLNILLKGIDMLKAGGTLLYSTCSLNPIEDEAVVLELMRRVKCGLQIIDLHNQFGVKARRGLLNWKVIASTGLEVKAADKKQNEQQLFTIYQSYEEASSNLNKSNHRIKPSMFPLSEQQMKKLGIHHTMRILPHEQNSGGFYLAMFKKSKQFSWMYKQKKQKPENVEQEQKLINEMMEKVEEDVGLEEQQDVNKNQNKPEEVQEQIVQTKQVKEVKKNERTRFNKQKPKKAEQFQLIDEEQFKHIQYFYGIEDESFRNNLFVRVSQDIRKKVTLVSNGVSKFLAADQMKKIKLINMGCKVFEKGKESFAGNQCLYRLCQDAIHFILPLISKRKVKITLNFFKQLIYNNNIKHSEITDEEMRVKIDQISQGSFVVYIQETLNGKVVIDAMVAQNFKNSMNVMISKEELQSLKIRYT